MKKTGIYIIILVCLLIGIIYYISVFFVSKNNTIPTINITLNDTTLNDINSNSKDKKYKDNYIEIKELDDILYSGNITIKGRGNSTWLWPKKPYQITLSNEENLFNLGSSKKWVLLANFVDVSNLRNDLAFYLARSLEIPYSFDGAFVNLYIDNEYLGIYYLTHKVEIGDDVVNLKNDDAVIMEIDNNFYNDEENVVISDIEKTHLVLKDIKNEDYEEDAVSNFLNKYNQLEEAIYTKRWNKINEYCDIESFAKYYLLQEFIQNPDRYTTSLFLYMDGKDDVIHIGPVWDFDRTFGNRTTKILEYASKYYDVEIPNYTLSIRIKANENMIRLFDILMEMNEFSELVQTIWQDNMQSIANNLFDAINSRYKLLEKSSKENNELWKYEYSFDESIKYLKDNVKASIKRENNKYNIN